MTMTKDTCSQKPEQKDMKYSLLFVIRKKCKFVYLPVGPRHQRTQCEEPQQWSQTSAVDRERHL